MKESMMFHLQEPEIWTSFPISSSCLIHILPLPASSQTGRKKPGAWGYIPWLLLFHPKYSISCLIFTWMLLLFSSADLGEIILDSDYAKRLLPSSPSTPPPFFTSGQITGVRFRGSPSEEMQCLVQKKTSCPQKELQDLVKMYQPELGGHMWEQVQGWYTGKEGREQNTKVREGLLTWEPP